MSLPYVVEGSRFRDRLKARRNQLRITQQALAELCGVTHAVFVHWESGRLVPALEAIEELAELLATPVRWLHPD